MTSSYRKDAADTTAGLWDIIFHCRILKKDIYSDSELEQFGVWSTGDKRLDRDLQMELIDVYINIDKMVEYHRRGVTIYFPNEKDLVTILTYIEEHLLAWIEHTETALHRKKMPVEDLVLLDDLASVIFEEIRHLYVNKKHTSSFDRYIEKFLAGMDFGQGDNKPKILTRQYVMENTAQRQSLKSYFLPHYDAAPVFSESGRSIFKRKF